jgi:heme exporter protein B
MFKLLLGQTIGLSFRKGGGTFGTLAFYIIVVTLFTFALGPEVMGKYIGAVLCVGMLLSFVTALPLMFERDHEDGTLEQLLLVPAALEVLMLAKICGQFISSMVPIILISPLLAMTTGIASEQVWPILARLCLASVSVASIGAIAAALTIGARRGGLLQALIMLPLYTPVLIFAASGGHGALLFLAGIACASLPFSCWVSAALVRASVD